MASERLLSRFRAACVRNTQARRPTACKIMSHGVLSTLLKDHLEAGGDDPRNFTRKQLSRLQVPVISSRGKPEPIANNSRASLRYAVAQEKKRHKPLPRAEFCQERRRLITEFQRLPWVVQALHEKTDLPITCSDQPMSYRTAIGTKLWGLSSVEQPIHKDVVERELIKHAPVRYIDTKSGPVHRWLLVICL